MRRAFVIGLTGGIATGKTSLLREFDRFGIPTISSDELAHDCLRKRHPAHARIVKRYGDQIIGLSGDIDRRKLGVLVFGKPAERKWLERQIHPYVVRELRAFVKKHRHIVVLDIPLLFEAKLGSLVDTTLVVSSSRKQQLARIKMRDGLDRKSALRRIAAQMPLAQKERRADYVIRNNGSLQDLKKSLKLYLTALGSNA